MKSHKYVTYMLKLWISASFPKFPLVSRGLNDGAHSEDVAGTIHFSFFREDDSILSPSYDLVSNLITYWPLGLKIAILKALVVWCSSVSGEKTSWSSELRSTSSPVGCRSIKRIHINQEVSKQNKHGSTTKRCRRPEANNLVIWNLHVSIIQVKIQFAWYFISSSKDIGSIDN